MSLSPGSRLGPYEIGSKLGQGGMGEVWRARDTQLEREVAIKVLPAAFVEDPERLARFEREAKLLAQLNHSNIAQIYGLEASGSSHALVMELVEGTTLAERLESASLPIDECLSLAHQITEALEEAHEKGIVHRDLKPQNIKLTADGQASAGRVKVLDFGLAKATDPAGAASGPGSPSQLAASPTLTLGAPIQGATVQGATMQGVILGTAAYMAPEQAKGFSVDKRADIWAFGVVLFEMLTGRSLFAGDSVADTLARVLEREIDFDALPASTPPAIRRLLRLCLVRSPRDRLRDIGDARLAIDEVLAGQDDVEASPPGPVRSRALLVGAASVAFVAAFVFGALYWRQLHAVPQPPRYEKVTYIPQFINEARFAPDGETIVLSSALEGDRVQLFVRRPDDPHPNLLATPDVSLLSVSSTGELAVLTKAKYLFLRTFVGTLARMPIGTATPREVMADVTAADWTPDGQELAVIRRIGDKSRLEYPIGKPLVETTGYLSDLRFSPRGDRIAFMLHTLPGDDRGPLVVVDLEGREVARSPEWQGAEGLAWSSDGQSLVFAAVATTPGSRYSVRSLALDGSVRTLLSDSSNLFLLDRAPDGRLLVGATTWNFQLNVRFAGAAAERSIQWLGLSLATALSADGRTLLFHDESDESGPNYSAYLVTADGAPPVRLGEGIPIALSPDGATVLTFVPSVPPRLVLNPTGVGTARDISVEGFSPDRRGGYFKDGRSVFFCGSSDREGKRCLVRDLEGGEVRAVTPPGTENGLLFPDDRALLAKQADGRWFRFPLDAGEADEIHGLNADDEVIRVRADGRSLLVYRPTEVPTRVERLDLMTGERTLVRELGPSDRAGAMGYWSVLFSQDETAYAYTFYRSRSLLFSVAGAQ